MKFMQDDVALEAVQLNFVWVGILAFFTYKMFNDYFVASIYEAANRL